MIVAKSWHQKLTVREGGISFSPVQGGNYRLSIYLSVNANPSATGTIYPSAQWVDNYASRDSKTLTSPTRVGLPYNSGGSLCWMADVYAAPYALGGVATEILLGTSSDSDPVPSGSLLDVYCVIEELSAPQL